MLILKRRCGEQLVIGDSVLIKVLSIRPGHVSLGIQAPRQTAVHRQEVYERLAHHRPLKAAG